MNEKKLRIFEVLLVLSIALLPSIITSCWSFFAQSSISEYHHYQFPDYLSSLIQNLLSVILMFYVLNRRHKNVSSIGVNPTLTLIDLFHSIAIVMFVVLSQSLAGIILNKTSPEFMNHASHPKNIETLNTKYTILLIALIVIAPLQEDLLIRGYTMTQVFDITDNKVFAVAVSVALQFLYHIGEGLPYDLMATPFYLITALYFIKFGKLNPVIIAHFLLNMSLLSRR